MTTKHVRAVSYLRVSTERQGKSGLGLAAQREAVATYLASIPGAILVEEFAEVVASMATADVESGHTEYAGGADYFGKSAN